MIASVEILLKVLSSTPEEMGKGAPGTPLANVEVVFCKAPGKSSGDDRQTSSIADAKDFTRLQQLYPEWASL